MVSLLAALQKEPGLRRGLAHLNGQKLQRLAKNPFAFQATAVRILRDCFYLNI
jgi:hypothetical protein